MAKKKQPPPRPGKRINIYFQPEDIPVLERCSELAKADRRSLSSWMVIALEKYLQGLDAEREEP